MRQTATILVGAVLACAFASMAEAASKPGATCASFMQDYPRTLGGFRVSFERPLTITRDLFGGEDGIDVHILSTDADVDGTLKCKGDIFRRFEVRVSASADEATLTNFARFEEAALATLFSWDRGKVGTIVAAMGADAREYLQASIQRGDTYRSGKVEYHQGGRYDLGLIWTESERTFIVTTQDEP